MSTTDRRKPFLLRNDRSRDTKLKTSRVRRGSSIDLRRLSCFGPSREAEGHTADHTTLSAFRRKFAELKRRPQASRRTPLRRDQTALRHPAVPAAPRTGPHRMELARRRLQPETSDRSVASRLKSHLPAALPPCAAAREKSTPIQPPPEYFHKSSRSRLVFASDDAQSASCPRRTPEQNAAETELAAISAAKYHPGNPADRCTARRAAEVDNGTSPACKRNSSSMRRLT